MSTNYYYQHPLLDQEDVNDYDGSTRLHIGKSAYGWVFSLHVYPERGINDLEDWEEIFKLPEGKIVNQYGDVFTAEQMIGRIRGRKFVRLPVFSGERDAINGPNGLLRSQLDRRCIKHGEGTWDCFIGYFS